MTLSVIIPAFNAATTLRETLDSLSAQTRGDWQAIIVDDGSTDCTRDVVSPYIARDFRFSLLADNRASEGVSAARNRGIAQATGRWLLFLDSDDWIDRAFVANMLGALEAKPGSRVAYCTHRRTTTDGRPGPSRFVTELALTPFEIFAQQCPTPIHAFVIDRALVDEVGDFDTSLSTNEDWDFWHRVARTGLDFLPVPRATAFYRGRPRSLSSHVETMLADARVVIARAFKPDPRVCKPAPQHASGADPEAGMSPEMALATFALWLAAFDVGSGGSGCELVLPLVERPERVLEACRLNILPGLRDGRRLLPEESFGSDPRFFASVRALLVAVEQATHRPGLALLLQFLLEPDVFRSTESETCFLSDGRLYVRQEIARLQPIELPGELAGDVDAVTVEFRAGPRLLARADVPMVGTLSRRDLTEIAIERMSPTVFLRESGLLGRASFWLRAAVAVMLLPRELRHARPRRGPNSVFTPRRLARRALIAAALAAAGPPSSATNARALARLMAEGSAQAARVDLPAPVVAPPPSAGRWAKPLHGRRSFWEAVYATADPWDYGSPFEQTKYRRTLKLLPVKPIVHALEVACSEGVFTAMLAAKVDHLIASDISTTALERARVRCRAMHNVAFQQLDAFEQALPGDLDLIVCSEVLYDLGSREALARVAEKMRDALAPGGHLLMTHGYVLKDAPERTGWDWTEGFGAQGIAEVMSGVSGFALERSLQTELYRVDLWRRLEEGEASSAPAIELEELGPRPAWPHAATIVWGGAMARRADVQARETTERLPVLMYHRVAEEGPAELARYRTSPQAFMAQMSWLRRHGYHAVTSSDVALHLAGGHPFKGRPVFITFDDGYRDFYDTAWPILRTHDFAAEVLLVTDRIGKTADWDADKGVPAPLMDWRQIQTLATQGVHFGSHMASHIHLDGMSSRQMALEAARSRATIERGVGRACLSIAAPFGEAGERFVQIARSCGYKVGLTTEPSPASLGSDPLRLPRIEVLGSWSIEAFAGAVRSTAQGS
jgi:peptidoglycan/xylan/chitin deacetylase (PgdA/CDA1 family)/GT2 family glycosyltransferase